MSLPITERELLSMVCDLRDAHSDCQPVLAQALADLGDDLADRRRGLSRRGLLAGGAGAAVLTACSTGPGSRARAAPAPSTPAPSGPVARLTGDLALVGLGAALENAAVYAYQQGIDKANSGTLGTVQPAVVTFVTTVQGQHSDHAKAWNGFLQKNKKPAITGIPLTSVPALTASLNAVSDVPGLAAAALDVETSAAATYIQVASGVSAQAGVATALSIAPVEAQHAAILAFILGREPVPDSLFDTTKAITVDTFTG